MSPLPAPRYIDEPAPSATAAPRGPGSELEALTMILAELRSLNANIARLEEDLRPLLPFRFGARRRG